MEARTCSTSPNFPNREPTGQAGELQTISTTEFAGSFTLHGSPGTDAGYFAASSASLPDETKKTLTCGGGCRRGNFRTAADFGIDFGSHGFCQYGRLSSRSSRS